jgi:RND family efflux transporter MFP subunit
MVAVIMVFIWIMFGKIMEERARLAEANKAAIKQDVEPIQVITLTLKPKRLLDKINLPAEIEPYLDVLVKAEVPGQVVKVVVEEGTNVTRGQTLVYLDDRDYRARLDRIRANYRLAKLDYDRNAALAKKQVTSPAKLDAIEAQLKDLEAQVAEAQLALSRTQITSPTSSLINEIKVEEGDFLAVGDPVAQILQLNPVKVTVGVPESDVAAVFNLDEANVIIDALNGLRVRGRKIFLARQPRTLARLYDLELSVPNPNGNILPGMFARVELVKQVFRQALTVPLYAVISQGEERFVFIEEDGRAKKRIVTLGILVDWQVQITSGLKQGDRAIVVGHRFLDEGQEVKIIKSVNDPREILTP